MAIGLVEVSSDQLCGTGPETWGLWHNHRALGGRVRQDLIDTPEW
jgi:hypothetical protein